jgi:ribosomal protein L37E
MALTNCPECGKEVSSQASACPHCGFPLVKSAQEPSQQQPQVTRPQAVKKGCLGCVGIIVIAVVIMIIIGGMLPDEETPPKNIKAAILADMADQHFPVASIKYTVRTPMPTGKEGAYNWQIDFEAELQDGRTANGFAYYGNYGPGADDHLNRVIVEKVDTPVR